MKKNVGVILSLMLIFGMLILMSGPDVEVSAASSTQEASSVASLDNGQTVLYYDTLSEVFSAANASESDCEITILKDCSNTGSINVNNTHKKIITLNSGEEGITTTLTANNNDISLINVCSDFDMKGSGGKILMNGNNKNVLSGIRCGTANTTLRMYDGFVLDAQNGGTQFRVINMWGDKGAAIRMYIYGGKVLCPKADEPGANTEMSTLVCLNESMYIYGGEFHWDVSGKSGYFAGVTDSANGLIEIYGGYFDGPMFWSGEAKYVFNGGYFTSNMLKPNETTKMGTQLWDDYIGEGRTVTNQQTTYNGTTYNYSISVPNMYKCTATMNDVTMGSVEVSSPVVGLNGSCTFTAVPNEGYDFLGWKTSEGASEYVSTSATYTVNDITADTSIVACFIKQHEHLWNVTVKDKVMTVTCLSETPPKCECFDEPVTLTLGLNTTKDVASRAYVTVKVEGAGKSVIPEYELYYNGIIGTPILPDGMDPDSATPDDYRVNSGSNYEDEIAPVDEGRYDVILSLAGCEIKETFIIRDNNSVPVVEECYSYNYPGSGVNLAGGFIDYEPREDIINYAYDGDTNKRTDKVYINMTKEKFVSSVSYACFSLDGGKKWIKGKLTDENLSKAFSKVTNIRIATKFDTNKKKPAEDAKTYYFATINKRPAISSLKVDYSLYLDPYHSTNGQWTLLNNGKSENLYQYYEIGISSDGKKIGREGFGIWPISGGVWVSDLDSKGKQVKETYFYRIRATVNTPASKTKKIKVAGVQKPLKLKADYGKEILKLKKGVSVFLGEELPNLLYEKYDFNSNAYLGTEKTSKELEGKFLAAATAEQAKGISIKEYLTDENRTIYIWMNASKTKPVTETQVIVLEARGVIESEKKLKCENGKVILEKNKKLTYEFLDPATGKWSVSVPNVTETTTVKCRIKCNAKGGKENGKTYATGIEANCVLTWGVWDAKSGKEGIVSAVIGPVA